ncbi:hypothetical protein LH128_00742 [Sphingomonas sp. LH128]|uniref:hypothetical protein n=1 Tax=Sphingomonas sp. LH128 TaxID=473781 RepID=UPI00027CBBAB|nr:hypothetical protein [Sphingomonas sp. LH128]EJU15066.1 hypothetical protein LH128_00742 [Sphingomonas sp. LH128]
MIKKTLLSLSVAAMVAAPVAAQAGTTASASVGKISNLSGVGARQSSVVKKKNNAESGTIILAALGVAAVGAGIYVIADDDNKSNGS